jgi:dTDP-4-dehydrorhamnose reductase
MSLNERLKILLLGKSGQVGWELARVLAGSGCVRAIDYPEVEFTSADSVRKAVRDAEPDVIVNAAAYTAVDKAETDSDRAMLINGVAPGVLAEAAKARGSLLVHYSTDYVFDGAKKQPYTEHDAPCPLNAYGRSKLAGDRAVQAIGGAHLIFRLSWVYSWRGRNFVNTMLKLGSERTELSVVDDQVGSPTAARCIAQATGQVLACASNRAGNPRRIADGNHELSGIYNLTCMGAVSWYGFAKAILENDIVQEMYHRAPRIVPISHAEYASPVKRPANSRLSNRKVYEVFGIEMPDWQKALAFTLEDIAEAHRSRQSMP